MYIYIYNHSLAFWVVHRISDILSSCIDFRRTVNPKSSSNSYSAFILSHESDILWHLGETCAGRVQTKLRRALEGPDTTDCRFRASTPAKPKCVSSHPGSSTVRPQAKTTTSTNREVSSGLMHKEYTQGGPRLSLNPKIAEEH